MCHFLLSLFLKIVLHGQEALFQTPIRFFWNVKVFYFSNLSSIDIDTIRKLLIETKIFFFIETISYSQTKD